jgi:hypothetical protein
MLEELDGMEHAVTSSEAAFLQSIKEMLEAELEPTAIHIARLKQVFEKYVHEERFDHDAQTDF